MDAQASYISIGSLANIVQIKSYPACWMSDAKCIIKLPPFPVKIVKKSVHLQANL